MTSKISSYLSRINSKQRVVATLMIGALLIILFFFFIRSTEAFSSSWQENFDALPIGLLRDCDDWAGDDSYFVTDDSAYVKGGIRGGKVYATTFKDIIFDPNDDISSGKKYYSYWQKPTGWTDQYYGYLRINFLPIEGAYIGLALLNEKLDENEFSIRYTGYSNTSCEPSGMGYSSNGDWDTETRVMTGEWVKFTLEANFDTKVIKVIPDIEGLNPAFRCFWFNNSIPHDPATLEEMELEAFWGFQAFDSFEVPPPPPVRVWGVTPDSGTEITDLDTSLVFGWEGMADYDGLLISFYNKSTGIHAGAVRFEDLSGEGEDSVNLQEFTFEENADWHFHAIAWRGVPEIYEGLYLTGRYITEYTENVVSPEYYLTINVSGFPTFFEMEDWGTWYGEHSKFDDPTALFDRFATLFDPTFTMIGEFGNRITSYFEVDKAYARGNELGLAIPIFVFYLDSIEMFFGGFPLIKLFLMVLLLLVGIFLFKLIMKFIPMLG